MATSTPTVTALGVDAGLDAGTAGELAARCAELGFHSLWSNDEPTAPGLETLANFAAAAPQLNLGVGVLPIDRYPPTRIAGEIVRLGLDRSDNLWVGIGSGQLQPQLRAVRDAVAELRDLLSPSTRIVVAAMRPQLCRLGGEIADAVLLNWRLPAAAAQARRWVREGAEAAGRDAPVTALYVRVAVGPGAPERLTDDERRYREIDPAHFAAMDVPLGTVGIAASQRPDVLHALAPYRSAVDLPIVRVLADRDAASLLAVADAAAP